MLMSREPYKTAFKFFNFVGLWDEISVWQERVTLKIPWIISSVCCLQIALSMLQIDSLDRILEVIEIVPMFMITFASTFNFSQTRGQLSDLLDIIDEIEIENTEIVAVIEGACRVIRRIFICLLSLTISVSSINTICPFLFGKLNFPAFTLSNCVIDFYAPWLMTSFAGFYCGISFVVTHEFRCSLLIILDAIMKSYRQRLLDVKMSGSDSAAEMVKCIKLHLQIQK
jgi:hypothetical protein